MFAEPRRHPLPAGPADPLLAARWLRADAHPRALHGAWAGGGTVLAGEPVEVLGPDDDPFAVDLPALEGDGVFGGWLGFWGFGLAARLERLPAPPPRPVVLPDFALARFDHVVRCDAEGRWWFEELWTPERAAALEARLALWRTRLAAPAPPAEPFVAGPLRVAGAGAAGHAAAVAAGVARIAAGEVFQANLCLRLEAGAAGDPLDLWVRAAGELRPAFAAFVGGPWGAVASLSPERFLRRAGREVVTEPIKGTAPRSTDPAALGASEKDRAENVMIADLMRNDLGRVCAYGSVAVDELCAVRPAAGVWHLVSTVRGRLRDGVGDADLLRAAFPPGSVVGAPKVQALRVVRELEGTAREAYCGAIGLVSPTAGLDLSVAIRTFEVAGGRVWLGAGGGVVSDSTPEAEVAEALAKAAPLAAASGLTIAPRNRSAQSSGVAPWALAEGWERPDPDAGLLETVLVVDGVAKLLGEHLARLRASAEALGLAFPAEVALPPLPPVGRARLRLVLDRDGLRAAVGPAPDVPTAPVVLRPWVLPGGLGAHKWADRRLVDALAADGTTPLFVDLDGTVLEAGYAAVVAQVGETLLTPVRDGRVLPSVTAAAAGAQEVRLTLGDLERADALHLASALRGLHPATLSRAHEVV